MRIAGAAVVITGAERGLGRALALALAAKGARVVASGLDRDGLERLAAAIRGEGGTALAIPCDVRDAAQVRRLAGDAAAALGGVDLLVNNAGVGLGGDIRRVSEEDWDRVLDVNLRGPVRLVQAVLPGMLQRGRGHIVNVASAAGLAAPALWIPYAATKFALVGFSEGLAAALRPRGIAVSVVCPMWVQTEMLATAPPPLAEAPAAAPSAAAARAWAAFAARLPGREMSPDTAARRIVRGIERGRFMIYTHRSTRWVVAARALAPETFARLWGRINALDERRHRAATP